MRPPSLWEFQFISPIIIFNFLLTLTSVFGYRDHHQDHYPRPKFIPSESNFTFHQGDTATLSCGVMDLGTKTVVWRRTASLEPLSIGKMIFESSTGYEIHHPPESYYWNLLIKNVQPEHADTYECQISTKDKMKKIVTLNVLDDKRYREPVINISGFDHVDKGQSIKLRCNATGASAPPDGIDWFKDGLQLQSNDNKLVSITKKFSYASRTMTSELEIKNAQMSDTGTYTCRTSDLQVTSVLVTILNAEKPIFKRGELGGPNSDKEQLQATKLAGDDTSGISSFHGNNKIFQINTAVFLAACLLLWFQNRR